MHLQFCFYSLTYVLVNIRQLVNIPSILLEVSVSGNICCYSHQPKRAVSPNMVTCHQVRGHCSFEMVTVTVSIPEDRVFPKNTGFIHRDFLIEYFFSSATHFPAGACITFFLLILCVL